MDDTAFRASVVGAGEVAALFDASPFLTRFELWHRKAGNIEAPTFNAVGDDGSPENERIWWGVHLEPAIVAAAKERFGYTERAPAERLTNGNGLGGHPDLRANCPKRGPGIVEVKTADWLVRKGWGDEPPLHYLLQSQAYQGLDGVLWGDVVVLVGGNRLERFEYEFRPKVYSEIERRVAEFWRTVREGTPPPADYARDLDTLKALNGEQTNEVADLTGDNRAAAAAREYLEAAQTEREARARKEAAQAELIEKLGTAARATLSDSVEVRATLVKAIPDRTAEQGEIIKGRKAYRRLTVKESA